MSRGFVKEEDQEEAPIIPKRAPLPAGTPNYVTENGLAELKTEMEALEKDKQNLNEANETERRRALTVINGKMALLQERIASAQQIDLKEQPQNEVRFGATVTHVVKNGRQKGMERTFQIVGVDESNIKEKKVAFTAPIVNSLMGLKIGEIAQFKLGEQLQKLEVTEIDYN